MRTALLLLGILLFSTGCTFKETYRVTVKNGTDTPLTVGFLKNGPPAEPGWSSPEDYGIQAAGHERTTWGEIIEVGKTANIEISGTFSNNVNAFLRVYLGKHSIDQLLALSRGSGSRIDLLLYPTHPNAFLITNKTGRIDAEWIRPTASVESHP